MKKNIVTTIAVKTLFVALIAAPIWLAACAELFNPPDKVLTGEKASLVNPTLANFTFTQIPVTGAPVIVCCTGNGSASDIVDNSTSTFWGTAYGDWSSLRNSASGLHTYYGPHWAVIDLGQIHNNITRIEYVPAWRWDAPGGYGSWSGGGGTRNNGVVTGFEVYISETPFPDNQYPSGDKRVAQGNWYALESESNLKITASEMKFFATFNSARGRYLQFRITAGYRNDWRSYQSLLGQIAELRVWKTDKAYSVYLQGLKDTLKKVEMLRTELGSSYGYTNAMLRYWSERAQRFLNDPDSITQEVVDYAFTNMDNYIKLSGRRTGMETYNRFIQKIIWADDNGSHLSAHGGGTMWDPVSQKWWFYGEDRTSWGSDMTGGGQPGVHAYSSADMYNWKDEGLALPIFNNTQYDEPDWREASSVSPDGFPGGWDGNRNNANAEPTGTPVRGFMWAVNKWRQSLGDWNSDGYIDPAGELYPNGKLAGETASWPSGGSAATGWYKWEHRNPRGPLSTAEQNERWAAISKYIPEGNPPLYLWKDNNARPYAVSMGLNSAKVDELNSLYRDTPVWRRKQLYRFWNHTTTVERPKVIFNAGTGPYKIGTATHTYNDGSGAVSKAITPYKDSTGEYPYVMYVHIEGGAVGVSYGTCKVLIAAGKTPAGPFKVLWAYHTHFVENYRRDQPAHLGMSRDQSVLVDDNGMAYHFGSTIENRVMGINMLDETYTQIVGIPRFAAGESQDEMIEEGFNNLMGRNFNYAYGDQREAPAPFLYYDVNTTGHTAGTTYEGVVNETTGSLTPLTPDQRNTKFYYMASSTSTGWFPNPQGVYRTSVHFDASTTGYGWILGYPGHEKPSGTTTTNHTLASGTAPTGGLTGGGWTPVNGNQSIDTGETSSFFFGAADDGSTIKKGYDGQTTNVQQLRYPPYKWDIVGFWDDNYVEPDVNIYNTPQSYHARLNTLFTNGTYRKPIYGPTEIPEPRAGRLVPGKYIHMSDSWDSTKNYDARYIWLPMRVVGRTCTNGAYGARARWMKEWRWEDFVYDLGPFAKSLDDSPSAIRDSTGNTSPSMWINSGRPQNLVDYYNMLNKCWGDSSDLYLNQGKQNPGQDWLSIWNP